MMSGTAVVPEVEVDEVAPDPILQLMSLMRKQDEVEGAADVLEVAVKPELARVPLLQLISQMRRQVLEDGVQVEGGAQAPGHAVKPDLAPVHLPQLML